jgi:predicted membrane channel-forming protein YqfA (hemolysin III family)
MTLQQRRSWTFLVVTIVAWASYAVYVVRAADGGPLTDVSYQKPLLISIVAAIVAAIVLEILLAIVKPIDTRMDMRDKEIGRLGDYTGYSLLVIGALAALLMSLAEWNWFWISNTLYLGFALSGILGAIAKLGMYAKGMP